MEYKLEKIQDWFSEPVIRVPAQDNNLLSCFLSEESRGLLTETARNSLLKTLKIPVKFFDGLSFTVQKDVINNQVNLLQEQGIDSVLTICEPGSGSNVYEQRKLFVKKQVNYSQAPKLEEYLVTENWVLQDIDFVKGYRTYLYIAGKPILGCIPVIVVIVPFFLSGKLTIDTGLFHQDKERLLIDRDRTDHYSFSGLALQDVDSVIASIQMAQERLNGLLIKDYEELLNDLQELPFSVQSAIKLVESQIRNVDSMFPKPYWVKVLKAIKKHQPDISAIGSTETLRSWLGLVSILFSCKKTRGYVDKVKFGVPMFKFIDYIQCNVE